MSAATMPELGIGRIGQVALPVRDVAESVRFYQDVLGLPLLFEAPPGLAFFDCAGVRLMLAAPEAGEAFAPAGATLYFPVADIHVAHAALGARGAALEGEPHLIARMPDHDLWMAFLRDPSGNLLALMSEVRAREA